MLTIDGGEGEGGGQVLRTALALSLITRTAFRMVNVRARRAKPGLARQHLTALTSAAALGSAKVDGAVVGSQEVTFVPGPVRSGEWHFAIGTAGSTSLVLQTVLPPLLLAPGPSRLVLEGGTHNVMAPPFDFIERAFLPLMDRMGPRVAARAERLGFYPGGGGRVVVDIEPAARLGPLHVLERGAPVSRRGTALIARLPVHIAERELGVLAEVLGWASDDLVVRDASSRSGPGNAVLVELAFEQVTEVFSAIGARGRPAEAVAQQAASEARAYLQSGAPVGPHLADQLLLPLALAGAGSFRTVPLTEHSVTNMRTIGRFLPVRFRTRAEGPDVLVMAGSDEPGGGR